MLGELAVQHADDVFEAVADDSSVAEMTAAEPAGNAGKTVPASKLRPWPPIRKRPEPDELCCRCTVPAELASPVMLALAAYDLDEFAETVCAAAGEAGLDVEAVAAAEEAVAAALVDELAAVEAAEDVVLHQPLAWIQHPIASVPLEAPKEPHLDR